MKFTKEIELFISDFVDEMEANNAAIFAGAGLSFKSGCVDWKGLLAEFAEKLDLDINKESDLISLAQYYLNKKANNRHALNKKILRAFHHGKKPNENHKILARLPISTFWTTNYDRLIEKSFEDAHKIVDVKYTTEHLAQTIDDRDVILYKMHGDVENPRNAIISKDQYEEYFNTHGAFINALSGDLVSKTFLFIGFSFTDPNLDYIFSRIRVTFRENQREHYCFFREVKQETDESDEDFEYRKIKQALVINDLLRFNINVLLVKEYDDVTSILQEIEDRYKRRTIYISGSAYSYGHWDAKTGENFVFELSKELIRKNFKIVSGFGVGVGGQVINGALEEIYLKRKEKLKDQLLLRPFPQGEIDVEEIDAYRKDMISYAGISIFVFGNKTQGNNVVLADGVKREFEISLEQKVLVVPIGATGFMARKLWERVFENCEKYFGSKDFIDSFRELGDEEKTPKQLIKSTIEFLNKIRRK